MTQKNIEQPLKATLTLKGDKNSVNSPAKDIKKGNDNVDEKASHSSKN